MRWVCAVVAVVAAVSAAEAQVVWVGAGNGMSWEWRPDSDPGKDWVTRTRSAPALFVAFPIDGETLVRVRAAQLPFDVLVDGQKASARLRGYTAGVDYFMDGVIGQAVFSAGLGGYRLELRDAATPGEGASTRFGWYVGVGEWFPVSKRVKVTAEVLGHQTGHAGRPTIITATVGLALSF